MLLVDYSVLDNIKVINETTANGTKKLKIRGRFQRCDEYNNNKRKYPKKILEAQVSKLQGKISERSLVGALDHPEQSNINLSQASHLITKLWTEKNGEVMGEAEILSTPSGKIVEALLKDGVKIGISSRGVGTLSESDDGDGQVVNEDFNLITFDLVSDPSTKGAYPELTESVKINSNKAQTIVNRVKSEQIFLRVLELALNESTGGKVNEEDYDRIKDAEAVRGSSQKYHTKKKYFPAKPAPKKKEDKVKEEPKFKQKSFNFKESIVAAINALEDLLAEGKLDVKQAYKDGHTVMQRKGQSLTGKQTRSNPSNKKAISSVRNKNSGITTKDSDSYGGGEHDPGVSRIRLAKHNAARGVKTKGNLKESVLLVNNAKERMVKALAVKVNEKAVEASLKKIEEGKGETKDKVCIKKYLTSHLSDLLYSYPYDPSPISYPYDDEKDVNEKIAKLKRILNVIDSI